MLNAEALATMDLANIFIRNVPVTIDRHVQTLEVDGEKALVLDEAVMSGPAGPLQQAEDVYSIDRKTMLSIANFTDDARVTDREGLVVGFPIGTEAADYTGWNGDTLATNTLTFVAEEEHEGLNTYMFTAASGPDLINDPVLLAQFPPALPKAVIEGLVPMLGLSDEAIGPTRAGTSASSRSDPAGLHLLVRDQVLGGAGHGCADRLRKDRITFGGYQPR